MNSMLLLFVIAIVIAAVLANIAVWSKSKLVLRTLAVFLTTMFVPIVYLGLTEVLSQPKPVAHEWFKRNVDDARVLGLDIVEGRAIYLWLKVGNDYQPSFYKLPWQPMLAQRLENLVDEGIKNDKPIRILNPFSKKSYDDLGNLNMEIVEPPSLPLKMPPDPNETLDPRKDAI